VNSNQRHRCRISRNDERKECRTHLQVSRSQLRVFRSISLHSIAEEPLSIAPRPQHGSRSQSRSRVKQLTLRSSHCAAGVGDVRDVNATFRAARQILQTATARG
jgi:hypothetical protein